MRATIRTILPQLCVLFLTAILIPLHAAAPPELTILRQQYENTLAERVTAPYETSLTELNTKFATALASAATAAKQAGKLDDILAIQDDQKRLTEKLPLPDDTEATPEALKKLRGIYHEQLKNLEDTRTSNHSALLPAYTTKLQALEATLVQADRIDEAKELRTYRENLLTGVAGVVPSAPASMAEAPVTPAPGEPTPSVALPNAAKREIPVVPPDQERAVALAAFDLGAPDMVILNVMHEGKMITDIRKPEHLPPGEIELTRIKIMHTKPPTKQYTDLTSIGGLQHLKQLSLDHFPLRDEDMEVIGTFPALEELYAPYGQNHKFTGSKLHLLAAPEKLLQAGFERSPIGGAGAEALGRCVNLRSLNLARATVNDDDLRHLSTLTKLISLDLRWTETSMEGMRHLKPLTSLESLGWSPDPKEPTGGFPELAAMFPHLTRLSLRHREGAKDEDYRGIVAFTNLKRVFIQGSTDARMALPGIATVPQIESLDGYWWDEVEDADLLPLQTHPALSSIDINSAKKITSKGLMHLSKIPKLKRLVLFRVALLTEADIAEFKRVRPDVEVTFSKQ